MELLTSRDWWSSVLNAWNADDDALHSLAGLGSVELQVVPLGFRLQVHWNSLGAANLVPAADLDPLVQITIAGTGDNWYKFLRGEFTAAGSILTRRLLFNGPFAVGLKYAKGFDRLSVVARTKL